MRGDVSRWWDECARVLRPGGKIVALAAPGMEPALPAAVALPVRLGGRNATILVTGDEPLEVPLLEGHPSARPARAATNASMSPSSRNVATTRSSSTRAYP